MLPEDVNVHDLHSVRITLAEDWVSIDDPRICGGCRSCVAGTDPRMSAIDHSTSILPCGREYYRSEMLKG